MKRKRNRDTYICSEERTSLHMHTFNARATLRFPSFLNSWSTDKETGGVL